MSLLQENFDPDYSIENINGIEFGDIFYLNYYGINVFFYVCGTDKYKVRIFELAKKKGKNGKESIEYLAPGLVPTSSPKVVLENNCWTKSKFWVETTKEGYLEIPVWDGPLIYQAIKLGIEYPVPGFVLAIPLPPEERKDIFKYYWPAPIRKNKRKRKINNFKISA